MMHAKRNRLHDMTWIRTHLSPCNPWKVWTKIRWNWPRHSGEDYSFKKNERTDRQTNGPKKQKEDRRREIKKTHFSVQLRWAWQTCEWLVNCIKKLFECVFFFYSSYGINIFLWAYQPQIFWGFMTLNPCNCITKANLNHCKPRSKKKNYKQNSFS